jgi:hypothetical protein
VRPVGVIGFAWPCLVGAMGCGAGRALWEAFPRGTPVDLRSSDPEDDDPANAAGLGADRVVRAAVVTALLLGAGDLQKGRAPAVRLVGARISGRLDLMVAEISHALVLAFCQLEERRGSWGPAPGLSPAWLPR